MRPIQLYSLVDRRQRRKLAAVQSLRRRLGRFGLGCGAFLLSALFAAVLALSLAYTSLVSDLPSLNALPELLDPARGPLMQPTRLYDRSGQQLLYSLENPGISRRYVSIDPNRPEHFSPELIRVTVGALDPTYWRSPGFSLQQMTNPQPVTIAERLVDDLLLWKEPRGLRHSLRMRVLAAQVIAHYGHVQVLEWYLNSAYYGHLAFGADSAARLYLAKSATQLSLPEAALLAAANQGPALNPLDAPQAAQERQRAVLDGLLKKGVINPDEYLRAAVEPLSLAKPVEQEASPALAFSRLVLDSLSERFGRERLERGGLRVITTLDYDLQLELSCLARTQLARLTGQSDAFQLPDGRPCASTRLLPTLPPDDQALPKQVTASAVVFDPQTGQVLALLGDTTPAGETSVLLPREPGSLLSPFVAVAGFARGMGPASLAWDIPASLPADLAGKLDPDGKFHGPVRLRLALANDYLAAQAQILAQVGAPNVWRTASAFGLTSLSEAQSPELLYRGGPVSLLEMAQAYGVFASQGIRAGQQTSPSGELRPSAVLYMEDLTGTAWVDDRQPVTQMAVSAPLAYLAHNVLSDATARRPSLGYPNALEIGRPSGAKIGQVEGGHQVWTAGYTPQRVAVFSLNLPDASPARLNPRMAAGMWHALMQYISRDQPALNWTEPPGITHLEVCSPSGQMPTEACPEIASEVFLTGSEPTGPDTLYRVFQVNRETGRLATIFTPVTLVEEQTFLVVPLQARAWAEQARLPLPPQEYDAIQPPVPSPEVHITSPALFAYVHGQVTLKGSADGLGFRFYQLQVGQGLNPQNWLQIGPDGAKPVKEGTLGVWDTRGQDGLYSVRLLVVHADQTSETAAIQVTVDNTPPLARIPYPINAQEFAADRSRAITFQAEVSDAIGVQRVVWLVDGKQVGETLQAPYAFTWTATKGEHTLQVNAYDLAGNEGKSEEVTFIVQ